MKIYVSVIVAIYNADWSKLKKTLQSILMQEGVVFEIILADDGSKEKFREETLALFAEYGFSRYKFSDMEYNEGTCRNILAALKMAEAPFVKSISPGDLLYKKDTLKKWLSFMVEKNVDISFGDAVYYSIESGDYKAISKKNLPVNKAVFMDVVTYKARKLDLLIACDPILGAAILVKTDVFIHYLDRLVEGNVIYAEDNFLRLAVLAEKILLYFPEKVIFYEDGTGISTSGDDKWRMRIQKDWEATDRVIMESCESLNPFSKKLIHFLEKKPENVFAKKIYKAFMFPEAIVYILRKRLSKTKTQTLAEENSFVYLLKQR